MTPQGWFITAVLVIGLGLVVTERLRADIGALVILLALWLGGVITPAEALSGFSRPAVLTLISLFIIVAALERQGLTSLIAERIVKLGGKSEAALMFLFMSAAALLSLFMANIAAGALLLPAAMNTAKRTGVAPSKLLMPLSFGTLLGGMATYFTTANIIISSTLHDLKLEKLGLFDFTPVGGVVMLCGIAYMMLIGRHLLPLRTPTKAFMPRTQVFAATDTRRAALTGVITVSVLILAAIMPDPLSIPLCMLLGAIALVLTGCFPVDEIYQVIDWKTIFLVAGLLPMSTAMINSGLAASLGTGLTTVVGQFGPLATIAGIYLMTVALGQFMSGQVVATVLAPIAISTALQGHFSPQAAALAVAIGCSTSFLTPIAHPVNLLVIDYAGYRFTDYFRVGWPLVIVCLIALLVALPIFWPLT